MNCEIVESCNVCRSKKYSVIGGGYDYEYLTTTSYFEFVRCDNCTHLYLKNVPVSEELDRIYPDEYLPYQFDSNLKPIIKYFRDFVQKQNQDHPLKCIQFIWKSHFKI